jgi:hypothetical protein
MPTLRESVTGKAARASVSVLAAARTSTSSGARRRCTGAATLTSADGSVKVEVSLLESRDGRPPQLRVITGDRKPQVVGLGHGQADPSYVEIDLSE